MADIQLAKLNCKGGVQTKVSTDNVTTPTEAEIIAAFGTAAGVGAGFVGIINDNGAESAAHVVFSTGTKYFFVSGTLSS